MPYDFLQDFHLHYGEEVRKHFDVRKGDRDGFLVVTNKRFAWQKKGALHPEVSIAARDLKRRPRKISSAAGMKMTLTTVDQHEYTFRFLAATSPEAAKARDEAIRIVVEVYNNATKQTAEQETLHSALAEDESKESFQTVEAKLKEEEKQRSQEVKRKKAALLERNPLLKELFIVGVKKRKFIKESLFWEAFKEELGRSSKAQSYEKGQHVGISSGLLSQFVRLESSDGQRNEIQLSTNVIKGIFKLYPVVEEAYKQHVLSKQIPESLFWKKVWFSPIFQRGSLTKHAVQTKDMFSDLGQRQAALREELELALANPLNDISQNDVVHDEEESSGHVVMKELKSARQEPLRRRRRNIALLNDDSTKILSLMGACPSSTAPVDAEASSASKNNEGASEPEEKQPGQQEEGAKRTRKETVVTAEGVAKSDLEARSEQIQKRLKESIELDDLQGEGAKAVAASPLHLQRSYRMTHANEADLDASYPSTIDVACHAIAADAQAGMQAARSFAKHRDAAPVSASQDDYIAIMQYEEAFDALLREYWLSVSEETRGPHRSGSTAQAAAKLLAKYRKAKLEPFRSAASSQVRALLEVLNDRVDRALLHAESMQAR